MGGVEGRKNMIKIYCLRMIARERRFLKELLLEQEEFVII